MEKYKLKDLVSNGSHSSRKVRSNVLVGSIENGYGYGDILDANATQQVATNIAETKINTAKQELLLIISEMEGGTSANYTQVLELLAQLQLKNTEQDTQDAELAELIDNLIALIQKALPTVGGDNDNLIF